MPTVHILPDPEAVAGAAAGLIAEAIADAIRREGRAVIALSGGSSPAETYRRLAAHIGIDWSRVHVCQVDERCVPPDHPQSNWRMIRETLIDPAGVPLANLHRMAGERDPASAAADYDAELHALFAGAAQAFDAVVLGIGEDGHVASLFPHSPALENDDRRVIHTGAPPTSPVRDRITLSMSAINTARLAVFVATGDSKASAIRRTFAPLDAAQATPAARVRPAGTLVWMLDEAAARGAGVSR